MRCERDPGATQPAEREREVVGIGESVPELRILRHDVHGVASFEQILGGDEGLPVAGVVDEEDAVGEFGATAQHLRRRVHIPLIGAGQRTTGPQIWVPRGPPVSQRCRAGCDHRGLEPVRELVRRDAVTEFDLDAGLGELCGEPVGDTRPLAIRLAAAIHRT